MRSHIELIEAALTAPKPMGLNKASARRLISHLEAARGQLADVVRLNPWLVGVCQEAAREKLPASFPVYRAVSATEALRADTIASTSLDWRVPLSILDETPSMIWHNGQTLRPRKVFMRYEVDASKIVLWMPIAVRFARQALSGQEQGGVQNRYGGRTRISTILDEFERRNEEEIVADLTGLTPRVLDVDDSVLGGERLTVFRAVMDGSLQGADLGAWRAREHITFLSVDEIAALADELSSWRV